MTTIDELFTRAKEVDASAHDLASSIAIAIWREMNNWQSDDKDNDFIKLHAQVKRVQDEIRIMSTGIRLVLEAARTEAHIVGDRGGFVRGYDQGRSDGVTAVQERWAALCEERALEWSGTAGVRGLNGAARDCAAARALEASCIADKIRSAEEAQG